MRFKNRLFFIFLILMVLFSTSIVCASENTTVEQTDELAPLSAIQTPTDQSLELDDFGTEDSMDDIESSGGGQHQKMYSEQVMKEKHPYMQPTLRVFI